MSQENVDFMREGVERWQAGDVDAFIAMLDPEIGWDISTHPLPDVPNHGRGRDALMSEMFAVYMAGWVDYSMELKELIDAGDDVIVVLHETATMRGSGVPLDRDLVQVWTVHDRRTVFLRVFKTRAEALAAVESAR